jgi:hypothetical protein
VLEDIEKRKLPCWEEVKSANPTGSVAPLDTLVSIAATTVNQRSGSKNALGWLFVGFDPPSVTSPNTNTDEHWALRVHLPAQLRHGVLRHVHELQRCQLTQLIERCKTCPQGMTDVKTLWASSMDGNL